MNGVSLENWAYLAQIFGVIAVIGGFAFALEQVRQLRQQRRDAAAAELMRSLQDADFTHAMRMIYALPTGCSGAELRALGETYEDAAQLLAVRFETIGILVHRRIIPLELVAELCGGVAMVLWSKLAGWANDVRAEQGQSNFAEWFQWLSEQFERRGRSSDLPAHVQHRDWQPV